MTEATLYAYQAALCALAIGLMVGLFRATWERAEVTDLVVELGETPARNAARPAGPRDW